MPNLITLIANDGTEYQFVDEIICKSSMIDVYFSSDKKCVLSLYRNQVGHNWIKLTKNLIDEYAQLISKCARGEYWKDLFNYPLGYVEWEGRFGVINPTFNKQFYFENGRFQGQVKGTKWFVSGKLRNKFLGTDEKGTWNNYYQICLKIAQITKLIHQVGLVYCDLSYNTIIINPLTGNACFITYDQLRLGKNNFLQNILPTPDFIAPEIIELRTRILTSTVGSIDLETRLSMANSCYIPNIETNNHALAVLIYELLLYRHPLKGGKVHDVDPARDEELTMGEKALFIEHPTDKSNRPKINQLHPLELPQGDTNKLPYTICGPYLKELFDKTFIEGLHNPVLRPTAEEWVIALSKTIDLLLPCKNSNCESKWFVFDNSMKPQCPFCGQKYHDKLPVLNFYYPTDNGDFKYENYRLMVYDNQCIYIWHINKLTTPEERFLNENYAPVANFYFSNGTAMIAGTLPFMFDKNESMVWLFRNVTLYQQKVRKEYHGRNRGFNIRICKGVYYKTGGFKGTPVETTLMERIGLGSACLTTKNLYFSSPEKSLKISYDKIVSIESYSNGIEIHQERANSKPIVLEGMDAWFSYNAISNLKNYK